MEFEVIENTEQNRFKRHDLSVIVVGMPFNVLMVKLKHTDKGWAVGIEHKH